MTRRARKGDKIQITLPDGTVQTFIDGGSVDLDKEEVIDENGERFTEALAQEVAERAVERLYRRLGRPCLDGTIASGTKSPQVSFRVPPRLAQRAEAVAAREGKSLSQLGREALERYLESAAS